MKKRNYPRGGGTIHYDFTRYNPDLGEELIKWQVLADRKRSEFLCHCLSKMFTIFDSYKETLSMTPAQFADWVDEHIN